MGRNYRTVLLGAGLCALVAGGVLLAQDAQQYPPAQQYPQSSYPQDGYPAAQPDQGDQQHGVTRLSIVQGDVNVRRGDNGELVAAVTNAPLTVKDQLQTSQGSRAEVELDAGNLIRLAPNTELNFADLEYHRYQVQLGAGTIIYRVLRNSNSQAEVDTPSVAFRPQGPGEYRISVLEDGTTQITVRSGQGEIYGPRGTEQLVAGHTTLVRGNPSDPEFQTGFEIARDQFDDWSENRDQQLLASQSYNYVSPDVPGADDLDKYGNWVPSQYGQVWEPQPPAPDWSPYSYGNWAWTDYYGWSWVDNAPWGWAPYHYGRWFWNGGYGWCWWPGPRVASVYWSPALVGFFGWGGFGRLGWVPLAPYEVFHPWWGHGLVGRGFGYGGYYGWGRNADVYRMYRNAGVRGGVMTAPYNGFGHYGQRFGRATRAELTNASLVSGRLPITPTRASYQFTNRAAFANPRLASAANRQFFRYTPSRQAGFAAGPRYSAPAQRGYSNGYASGGWQRFGDPGRVPGNGQSFRSTPGDSGWHRFGQPQAPSPQRQGYYGNGYNGRGSFGARPSYPGYSAPRYSAPSAPRYSAPAAPRYSAPRYNSAPHYSAPAFRGGGGGGGGWHGGGGGGGRSGGGGHGGGGHHR
ncbi:MAG TPA: FecR family protein [Bryobacteraceae bacterium]|jgi:hypothetical protein|nr:FecR family protein [Bryobacteraceae bacterium]